MTIFGLILAIIKAIPALKDLFDQFVSWYVDREITNMKEELSHGIFQASMGDQRNLEKYVGSPRAGLPSGEHGSTIVDELPGVPKLPNAN
jgi:hypothetical protein